MPWLNRAGLWRQTTYECKAGNERPKTRFLRQNGWRPEPGCTTTSQPINLLPRWQKVRQSRATQPRWATTSAVQPTFWESDSFNSNEVPRSPVQLAPNRCVQPRRRVGLGTLSSNPAQSHHRLRVSCGCLLFFFSLSTQRARLPLNR